MWNERSGLCVPIIAGVRRSFDFHKVPALSFVRHCKLSVDVVNIIDQNHAAAVLPTGKVPLMMWPSWPHSLYGYC